MNRRGPHRFQKSPESHGNPRDATIRAFISIELPEPVRLLLQEEVFLLRKAGGRASWVRAEHMHLTLRFLDEITEEQKSALSECLRNVCTNSTALKLAVEGLGAFPNLRKPDVIWAGVRLVEGNLTALQQGIEQAAETVGLHPDNKPFHPHVTLARIRDRRVSEALVQAVRERAEGPPPVFGDEFRVGTVALFRSELKPDGPVHTRLEEFPLSCKSCS